MQEAKHTPGPWATDSKGIEVFRDTELGPDTVAQVVGHLMRDEGVNVANARLIAAAPELLEALQEVLYEHGGFATSYPAAVKKARAVIAKATGREVT